MIGKEPSVLPKDIEAIGIIREMVQALPVIALSTLPADRTALVVIDMVNGFAREGTLSSPRVASLIPKVARLMEKCKEMGMPILAFADTHSDCSPEFGSYPRHCLSGTQEPEVVDELKAVGGYTLIAKNSTNGFLEEPFREWIRAHHEIGNLVVIGDCTDICVEQMSISLKAHFNRLNLPSRVMVVADAVDTFDTPTHIGDFMHIVALYFMMQSGVEVIASLV